MNRKAALLLALSTLALVGCGGAPPPAQPTKAVAPQQRVVTFVGDSITLFWGTGDYNCSGSVPKSPIATPANYTIEFSAVCGYRTDQMLLNLLPQVLGSKASCVHIIAGTNDVLQGIDPAVIHANIQAMIQDAKAAGVCVYLGTPPPLGDPGNTVYNDGMRALVEWIRTQQAPGVQIVDYFAALVSSDGITAQPQYMRSEIGDWVHPSRPGYTVMDSVLKKAMGL